MAEYFAGDKIIFSGIAIVVLLGAFLTVSLVPLWAPGKRNMYIPEDDTAETESHPQHTAPAHIQHESGHGADGLHTISEDNPEDKA